MTLNLLSELEGEVAQARRDLGQTDREISATAGIRPTQFRGIESVPLAAAVSEVVVRIAALQRHFRTYGNVPPPESATGDFKAIECRDAVLAWDGGTPRPAADWPQADFIVGNPPFIGNSKMRRALGDSYVEGLRTAYPDMPGTVDYAMLWVNRAATLVRDGKARRFGFITSRTIGQPRNRGVLETHMQNRNAELRERWWLFLRPRPELRESLQNISRYIATPGTARRRYFVFLDTNIIPDAKLLVVASDDAYLLGVLSSRLHQAWALALGGRLGAGVILYM